jgi:hypothetical protein
MVLLIGRCTEVFGGSWQPAGTTALPHGASACDHSSSQASLALSEDGSHYPGSFAGLSQEDTLPQFNLSSSSSIDVSAGAASSGGGSGGVAPPTLSSLTIRGSASGSTPSLAHGGSSGYRPSGMTLSPHASGYNLVDDPGLRRRKPKQAAAQEPELEPVTSPAPGGRLWYYLSADHHQQGPVNWADLQRLVDGKTFLFTEGLGDWKLAEQLGLGDTEPAI